MLIVVIHADFFDCGGRQIFGGPIFEEPNEILLLNKALKFVVTFSKYALKSIKIRKTIEKIQENANFSAILKFSGGTMGKIRDILWTDYS